MGATGGRRLHRRPRVVPARSTRWPQATVHGRTRGRKRSDEAEKRGKGGKKAKKKRLPCARHGWRAEAAAGAAAPRCSDPAARTAQGARKGGQRGAGRGATPPHPLAPPLGRAGASGARSRDRTGRGKSPTPCACGAPQALGKRRCPVLLTFGENRAPPRRCRLSGFCRVDLHHQIPAVAAQRDQPGVGRV